MKNTPNYSLRLHKIYCYLSDEVNGDELFIKYKGDKIWPVDSKYLVSKQGSMDVGVRIDDIDQHTVIKLELWDYDFFSPNDKIGEFELTIDERGGPFKTDLKTKQEANYSLEWEVY